MNEWTVTSEVPASSPGEWSVTAEIPATPPPISTNGPNQPSEPPAWAGEYPNLYGAYGAGRALLRSGVEAVSSTLGAVGGAMIPVPGASLVGAGVGYAAGKRAANAILNEPIDTTASGIGTDVAVGAVLQGGASLLGKVPGVGKIFSPKITAVGPERTLGADVLDKTAYSMYEKSLKIPPGPAATTAMRETSINKALDAGIPITKGGLKKQAGLLEDLGLKMDEVVANSPNKDNLINTDSVINATKDTRDFFLNSVNGEKAVKEFDDVMQNFKDQWGDTITVEKAQELKQNTGVIIKKYYGQLQGPTKEAMKQLVRGLKDNIANEIPELAGVNLGYSQLKTLEPFLERAVKRTGNWDIAGLIPTVVATAVGGATGKIASAVEAGALWRVLRSPAVQSHLAITLHKMGIPAQSNVLANSITQTIYNRLTGRDKAVTGATGSY